MTIEKKNPNATAVAAASNVITAINDRHNRTETAAFGTDLVITFDSTSESLSAADLWGGRVISLAEGSPAPGGDCTLTVASGSERGDFIIDNGLSQDCTVTISGQSATAPVIPAGGRAHLRCDGTNVEFATLALSGVDRIVEISQAAYDALSPADSETLYVITS